MFDYRCTNEQCESNKRVKIILSEDEVTEDRKCIYCGSPTEDIELYDGNSNCKHEELKNHFNGIKCSKCKGWFCY